MDHETCDDDIHERPTLPYPAQIPHATLAIATPSDDFFATGVSLELAHRRQTMLVRCVAFVMAVAVVITIAAASLDAVAFMHFL